MATYNRTVPRLLEGRLALVTGAGQGIGRAIALGLSHAGAHVIATDIQEAKAVATTDAICCEGGTAWCHALDVTQADACHTLAARIGAEIEPVDLLVNCAGIIIREGIDSADAARHWQRTFDVNVNGPFNVVQALLPALRATHGTIVNLVSLASFVGLPGALGYSASKGALKLYTQTLAAELARDGVRVNAIAPGLIATPMNAAARESSEFLQSRMARTPLGRVGQPEDLVGPAVFLSSAMSNYVTGVTLAVDGGFLAV